LRFTRYSADIPAGVAYGEALSAVYYDCAPIKEFRKRYNLTKLAGAKYLLSSILKAYKEFGGKKPPRIAVLEFRHRSRLPNLMRIYS